MSDQEQLTPQQEREYVEAAWEKVDYQWSGSTYRPTLMIRLPLIWWEGLGTGYFETEEAGWHAAYLFTKEHKGELKRRRYAISLLKLIYAQGGQGEWKPVDWKQDQEALEQVIAREEAALADLLRGWREKGDGNGRG